MLKTYANNLSKYWEEIMVKSKEFSIKKKSIFLSVSKNIGAFEIEFAYGEFQGEGYEIGDFTSFIFSKYDIKTIDNSIYFGETSFLIIKPLIRSNWTEKQSEI